MDRQKTGLKKKEERGGRRVERYEQWKTRMLNQEKVNVKDFQRLLPQEMEQI
jgi:hypothetical protein